MRELLKQPLSIAIAFSFFIHLLAMVAWEIWGKRPFYPRIRPPAIIKVELVSWPKEKRKKGSVQRKRKTTKKKKKRAVRKKPKKKAVKILKAKKVIKVKKFEKERKEAEELERRRQAAIREIEAKLARARMSEIYFALIRRRVKEFWAIPDLLSERTELKAVVIVKIDGNGRIMETKLQRSSGNLYFDRCALQAVAKAEPFPPPPGGVPFEVGLIFQP